MSSIPNPPPPPPPPPPAPPLPPPEQKCNSFVSGFVGQSPDSELLVGQTETKFVSEQEFITQLCDLVRSRIGDVSSPGNEGKVVLAVVTPLERKILQNGPMCGIVALAEAIELLPSKLTGDKEKLSASVPPKIILEKAIELGFTKQGEMFSVEKMKSLATLFGGNCEDSRILDFGKESSTDKEKCIQQQILQHILEGYPVLIPYDADFNHSPSMRNGIAAHWAVIHGLVFPISFNKLSLDSVKQSFEFVNQSSQQEPLVILKPNRASKILNKSEIEEKILKDVDYEVAHVIAHQGKSFRTAIWKFKDVLESNRNLVEMSPKIRDHAENFVFDNIHDGLCSKILLLK